MFSKQHYEIIAEMLKKHTIYGLAYNKTIIDKEKLIKDLCVFFHNDDERFSEIRFREACE